MNNLSHSPLYGNGPSGMPGPSGKAPRRSLLHRLRQLLQLACPANSHRMMAVSRTVCALMLLLLAMTGQFSAGFHIEFIELFIPAFACLSLITLAISTLSWYIDFALSRYVFLIDLLVFSAFAIPHGPIDSGIVASALCLIAHILFSSVLRWQFPIALAIAAFLNTFWIAQIVLFELPHGNTDQGSALCWIVFAVFESLIILWAGSRISTTALPRFESDEQGPGLPLTASAFDYVIQTSCASNAVLCWIDPYDGGCFACSADEREATPHLTPKKLGFIAAAAFRELEPMLFDLSRDKAVVSGKSGRALRSVAPVPGHALLRELGVQSGICIPANTREGQGWFILNGIVGLGWGHLQLAHAICDEVAFRIDRQIASANARDEALARLRQTLASDLHDSVAHSLAGARFLLVALRSKVTGNPDLASEIDSIKTALDAEHLHVRRLIAQLREAGADKNERNLIEDLEIICPALALRWHITVQLTDSDFRIQVPVWLSLEIQQIVREAIGNGVRHGQATEITIKCKKSFGAIRLDVTDNGSGFRDSVNPRSIIERVSELGGSLDIASQPGSTTLQLTIPLVAADGTILGAG